MDGSEREEKNYYERIFGLLQWQSDILTSKETVNNAGFENTCLYCV